MGSEDPHRERAEHGEVAVGEVDDPHHAEHEREPAGEHRVVPAEKHALDDLVDPDHVSVPSPRPRPRSRPKYAWTTCSRVISSARPLRTICPSSMQQTRVATDSARLEVLLDEDDRRPTLDQRAERLVHGLNSDGREPERRLVEEQEARVRHQGARDRGRLLLTTREVPGSRLPERPQEREGVENAVHGPRPLAPALAREPEVLLHGQPGEETPSFRHEGDPHADAA